MPLAGDLPLEPLRGSSWFFVVSVLNTYSRALRTNHAAVSHMPDPSIQHCVSPNARAMRVRELRRVSPQTAERYLRNMSDTEH